MRILLVLGVDDLSVKFPSRKNWALSSMRKDFKEVYHLNYRKMIMTINSALYCIDMIAAEMHLGLSSVI